MKKILTLILFSVITLSIGCKKSETPELKTEVSLRGTWELRRINGVQIAGAPSVFVAGNGRILQFTDKEFTQVNAGTVVKSGTYMLTKESSWADTDDRLVYDSDDLKRFVTVQNNMLTIYVGSPIASDGWEEVYELMPAHLQ
ncbi:hypothetical protein GZH53_01595 [Flavihumibacter sp. R14]|nr:hypothetical protein [Flavihumibacter soli]